MVDATHHMVELIDAEASRQVLTFGDLLREHRRSRPARLAVVDGDVRLTYEDLDRRVNRLVAALRGAGVGGGDRVLWIGQNSSRVLELLLAAAKLGALLCPANWRYHVSELGFVLADLDPRVVVWQDEEIGETARAARAEAGGGALWLRHDAPASDGDGYEAFLESGAEHDDELPVDPAAPVLAFYTAAFGGHPHAALLSHAALVVQNLVIGRMQDITDESVFLNSGPLFHVGTFMTTSATFHHGGANVFLRRTDAEDVCRLVQAERCTHAFLMGPTLDEIRELNRDGTFDLSSLWADADPDGYRGGMVSPRSSPWAQRPGGFGQTEVVGLATFAGLGSVPAGGAGRPVAAQVRIAGPDGAELGPGEVGEIVVRGPIVTVGYWGRPELNAERGRDGWHHTNDLGRREEDGSLTFVGPKTTVIKSAAENIYPAEVEAALMSHPDVVEACVIGVPDERWTQSVKAVVVRREGSSLDAEALVEHCRERIASYKKPRIVEFVDRLPRTQAGMVDRARVDAEHGGGGYPGADDTRMPTEEQS